MSQDRALFDDRMLEGEYTTWNWLWTRDYGAGTLFITPSIDNFGTVYVGCNSLVSTYIITRANVSTIIAATQIERLATLIERRAWSATRKYFAMVGLLPPFSVRIFRYGVNVANVPYQAIVPTAINIGGMGMSANGKYIAVLLTATASFNGRYVVLLEGR